jgi:hypothetical protein
MITLVTNIHSDATRSATPITVEPKFPPAVSLEVMPLECASHSAPQAAILFQQPSHSMKASARGSSFQNDMVDQQQTNASGITSSAVDLVDSGTRVNALIRDALPVRSFGCARLCHRRISDVGCHKHVLSKRDADWHCHTITIWRRTYHQCV